MPRTLWSLTGGGVFGSGFVIWVVGSAVEIYLMGLVTGLIGWKMEGLKMDSEDLAKKTRWTAVMLLKGWEAVGLAVLYGAVMVWGYVVATVFYCECRKQHVVWEVEGGSVDV